LAVDQFLSGTPSVQISAATPPTISGTRTPPSINIQGSNPAMVYVGDDNSSPAVNIEYSYKLQGGATPMPDSCWACM
jgi:hypothetical protein